MVSVLIIDDDPGTLELLGPPLSGAGYVVCWADGGLAGLKLFNGRPFDLVVTEILMPEPDGLEVIANLRMNKFCPKIIATFKRSPWVDRGAWLVATRLLGADKVLFKPLSAEKVLACLRELA